MVMMCLRKHSGCTDRKTDRQTSAKIIQGQPAVLCVPDSSNPEPAVQTYSRASFMFVPSFTDVSNTLRKPCLLENSDASSEDTCLWLLGRSNWAREKV